MRLKKTNFTPVTSNMGNGILGATVYWVVWLGMAGVGALLYYVKAHHD
jgi:hypothetical protein